MKKKIVWLLVLMMVVSIFAFGCGKKEEAAPQPEETAKPKVGFVYVGPIGDGGWTYAHNEGRLFLEQELGVETLYVESVPESQEVEKVMADMIDQGASIIFTTSFGYMDYTENLSNQYPEVVFMHCSGYKQTENMGNYFGRIYQPRYLSGIVAGLKTETNKIGYVAAFDIPEVVRGINAFTLGARSVNPEAVVKVKWTSTWYDPAKEKEAAKALLDEGVDIIAQHQDTAGPQQAAEEAGAFSIGYNTDMFAVAPKAYMTAPIWNWGPYYVKQVQQVMDGTWQAESYWGSMADGIVELAPLTENAPEEAKALVEEAAAKIVSGELNVFAGPIKNQSGEIVVPEGSAMEDGEMLSFSWFVEGVEGQIGGN